MVLGVFYIGSFMGYPGFFAILRMTIYFDLIMDGGEI